MSRPHERQNGVTLNGKLADVRASQGDPSTAQAGLTGSYVAATLVTDHLAYGGHHQVLFPEEHAADVLAYWGLTDGNLEVAVEGWLRSTPASAAARVRGRRGGPGDLPLGHGCVARPGGALQGGDQAGAGQGRGRTVIGRPQVIKSEVES